MTLTHTIPVGPGSDTITVGDARLNWQRLEFRYRLAGTLPDGTPFDHEGADLSAPVMGRTDEEALVHAASALLGFLTMSPGTFGDLAVSDWCALMTDELQSLQMEYDVVTGEDTDHEWTAEEVAQVHVEVEGRTAVVTDWAVI